MKIAGIKITKTATGKVKEVTFAYSKYSEYLMDVIRAEYILKHDKVRVPFTDIVTRENKRRGMS